MTLRGFCQIIVLVVSMAVSMSVVAAPEGAHKVDGKKAANERAAAKKTGGLLRALEASMGQADHLGPSIAVPADWRKCKTASDCEVVYSSCGAANVTINKLAVDKAKAAWTKRCAAANRKPMGLMVSPPKVQCKNNRCQSSAFVLGEIAGLQGAHIGKAEKKSAVRKNGLRAFIKYGRVERKGDLHEDVVRRVLRQHRKQLVYCYEKTQRGRPPLAVNMNFKAEVSEKGRVTRVAASAGPKGLRSCITRKIRRFRFPAPKTDGAEFQVTARFEPVAAKSPTPNK